MTFCLRIALLVSLIIGTHTEDFNLLDALGDPDPAPTPAKPKDTDGFDLLDAFGPDTVTKKPVAPPPKDGGAGGDDFNILDAFDNEPKKPDPKKPSGGGIDGFDLEDALGPDPKPDKPAVVPPKNGGTGGGSFDDGDLFDIGNDNEYKPDGGKPGGRASDPGSNQGGGADQPQDLDHLWGQFLKLLDANMPAEVQVWINNLKRVVKPLLERANELFEVGQ
ncbi:CD99 molecule isoform X4 [Osmerus mordax]|uniref:CD99 molecule isoform X4 n=1 Tax=Osmerus mordax TaxID=8014 RepID=UPI003510814B